METPQSKIIKPADACMYFSNFSNGIKFIPLRDTKTIDNIVPIVVNAKTDVTRISPSTFSFAAGYIRIGINVSHGPNTKIVKSTHGVMLTFFSDSCT